MNFRAVKDLKSKRQRNKNSNFLRKNLGITRKIKTLNNTPNVSAVSKNLQFIGPLQYVRHKAAIMIIFILEVIKVWLGD